MTNETPPLPHTPTPSLTSLKAPSHGYPTRTPSANTPPTSGFVHLDRLYYPVETLGPGRRLAVWFQGCPRRCPGCANPELWEADDAHALSPAAAARLIARTAASQSCTRVTLTGGEPFLAPAALLALLELARPLFADILIYTGYELEELDALLGPAEAAHLRRLADALIDGPYKAAQNDGLCALRGSHNQRFHLFNEALAADYDEALRRPRRVQNVYLAGEAQSIGIHGRP